MSNDLKQLERLMELQSLKSQQAMAQIRAEEVDLRNKIATLNEHRKRSHATDPTLMPMRAIRADVLWQSWIDRTQADLTTDLALVLARKEGIQRRAARSIGRHEVALSLLNTERKNAAQTRTDAELGRAAAYTSLLCAIQKKT